MLSHDNLDSIIWNAEGRPDRTGLRLSNELAKLDVPVKLLIDSAVAYSMDEVDMVFVGADGVVESGGVINMMGTYQIALVAKSMNKPVYVAAESYKVGWKHVICYIKDFNPRVLRGILTDGTRSVLKKSSNFLQFARL